MRFAILFAGFLIALSIDAEALWANFSFWFIYPTLFLMLYLDILTLSFDNVDQLKKFVEENKKKTSDIPPPRPPNVTQ